MIALTLYSLAILVRNMLEGLRGVPADVLDAADGMGYTRRRRLLRVELPLALPAIVAGIRLATVSTIGLVTVTFIVDQGGLGRFIQDGYRARLPHAAGRRHRAVGRARDRRRPAPRPASSAR